MISISLRAERDGLRTPCSHASTVFFPTPTKAPNCSAFRPVCFLICLISSGAIISFVKPGRVVRPGFLFFNYFKSYLKLRIIFNQQFFIISNHHVCSERIFNSIPKVKRNSRLTVITSCDSCFHISHPPRRTGFVPLSVRIGGGVLSTKKKAFQRKGRQDFLNTQDKSCIPAQHR